MAAQLLQINYTFHGSRETAEREFAHVADKIAQVPGLRWKIWIFDDAASRGGGIYMFDDRASLDSFVSGQIVAALKSNPAVNDVSVQAFGVLTEPTRLTRGPV